MHSKSKKAELVIAASVILFLVAIWFFGGRGSQHQKIPAPSKPSSSTSTPAFNKHQYSIDDSGSLWVVVNKGRILPSAYVPAGLVVPDVALRLSPSSQEMHVRADTAVAMKTMFDAAASEGIHLMLASGYRSYSLQASLYNGYVKSDGLVSADASSAHPGHSEHQTGLAADLEPANRTCEVEQCFDGTPEGKWLAVNSYKYGFIIRYQKGQEDLTGYEYEPWHVRYVGVALATQIHQSGQTLEQFFGLPAYTDYPANSFALHSD